MSGYVVFIERIFGVQRICINCLEKAEKIGIAKERAVTYENDHRGVALNYETVGRAVIRATKSRDCRVEFDEDWADEIVKYRESKKGES